MKVNAAKRQKTSSPRLVPLKKAPLRVAVAVAQAPAKVAVAVAVVAEAHLVLPPKKTSQIQPTRTKKTRARP